MAGRFSRRAGASVPILEWARWRATASSCRSSSCRSVLLPGELLPLHIFEERYKRMIGHCLDDGEPFGIVFRDDEGARAPDRLHGARHRGPRALRRRPPEHRRHRRAPVPGARPLRGGRLPRRRGRAGRATTVRGADDEAADRPARPSPSSSSGSPARHPTATSSTRTTPTGSPAASSLPPETKQRLLELRAEHERMADARRRARRAGRAARRARARSPSARR